MMVLRMFTSTQNNRPALSLACHSNTWGTPSAAFPIQARASTMV